MDMLHGPLLRKILLFTLPIALSSMLQQLFNAADTSVVGYFADANALAAVGTNGEIVAFLVTLSAGLAVGANVLVAQRIGEGNASAINTILHTAIRLALSAGIICLITGQLVARPILVLIRTPADVLDSAILYLRIYLIGMPFVMLYDFGAAILRAKGDSRSPFITLAFCGFVNVILNLFLVVIVKMNVAGVALATDIANALAALLVMCRLIRHTEEDCRKILENADTPDTRKVSLLDSTSQNRFGNERSITRYNESLILRKILMIGIPSALQGAVFCFANIFVQASVNRFGAVATAGSTIAMNFEYFVYYMITAFGQTATTFTGQNYAAGNKARCKKVFIICLAASLISSVAMTLPLVVWRETCAGLFSTDREVIAAACLRIMAILTFEPMCSLYEVAAGALRGMGHSTLPAVLTIVGTCALRIGWILTVFSSTPSLSLLFMVFPLSWVVTSILMIGALLLFKPYDAPTRE